MAKQTIRYIQMSIRFVVYFQNAWIIFSEFYQVSELSFYRHKYLWEYSAIDEI